MTTSQPTVSRVQCDEWHDENDAGTSIAHIARREGVHRTTVSWHVNDHCREGAHVDDGGLSETCPFCGARVGQLPPHLPCDGTPPDTVTGATHTRDPFEPATITAADLRGHFRVRLDAGEHLLTTAARLGEQLDVDSRAVGQALAALREDKSVFVVEYRKTTTATPNTWTIEREEAEP